MIRRRLFADKRQQEIYDKLRECPLDMTGYGPTIFGGNGRYGEGVHDTAYRYGFLHYDKIPPISARNKVSYPYAAWAAGVDNARLLL